jgi:4-hydroxy-3-polyprenylbenzoate decarboxylase
LIVAITGATGAIYGIRLLEALRCTDVETHLIVSEWAMKTMAVETDYRMADVAALADRTYRADNQAAAIASGSCLMDGMIVAPCSAKTLAGIATGYADNLITRCADVTMKEQRKLVLQVRESPLNAIQLENMLKLARTGVVIAPPVPAFYAGLRTLEEMVDHSVGRLLDHFQIPHSLTRRWGEARSEAAAPEPDLVGHSTTSKS